MNRLLFSTFIVLPLIVACSSEREERTSERRSEGREYAESHAVDQAHASGHGEVTWDYDGEDGPDYWGELKEEFTACKTGQSQSPIDIQIHRAVKEKLPAIEFHYQEAPLSILNNGHTIQVNYPAGSSIKVGDASYELVQFHFHTPSEHTINGKPFPMVAHLVHKDAAGDLGVIGVMMKEGGKNPIIDTLWKVVPKKAGEKVERTDITIDATALLPEDRSYFAYSGSLTTPPCSESVSWMVLKTPVEVSGDQVAVLASLVGNNARPVQALNGRTVTHH